MKTRIRILEVNDVEQEWEGVFELFLHYELPESGPLDICPSNQAMNLVDKPEKCPEFLILNDESSEPTEQLFYRCSAAPGIMFVFLEFKVVLHERLELQRFPFDRQNFTFEFECTNSTLTPWSCAHIPEQVTDELGSFAASNFIGECDSESWNLDRFLARQTSPSRCCLKPGLSRLPSFYLWNIVFPVFMIVQIATLTSAIDYTDYGSRFSCMLTLLLTIVAFKFVTSSFVPKVSYQTFLDVYTLTGYVFLAVWMLENFFVSPLFDATKNEADHTDKVVGAVYTIAWISLHIIIVIGSKFDWFRKSWAQVDIDDVSEREGTQIAHDKFM